MIDDDLFSLEGTERSEIHVEAERRETSQAYPRKTSCPAGMGEVERHTFAVG
jgi:hypothetical protein